ncbi:2Fe-2S iron-sulfur cluster binding domain-containing protein [Deferribacter autotrophicus]|uniref:2Fe-2S iron-sulfur cluster binding domain-containing protein n=1 Tax=Deferribacter autotrophicus TaxID=500465 RepID=A0A5A8F483_9BACT|nr:2Fe-2S iron-sulfur cluster binding domain-containing protein [Deferribacter autotrophicus]KAA0258954.1 2Fe-2S iron-sulfur cluster binding domain-containing protein [Deferribacter autotrophicus]
MFFGKKVKINVKNKNIVIEAKSGANLYDVLVENNIHIESLCKGNGQCGKCKVKIISADGKEINKPTKKDRLVLAKINLENGYRLACQYNVKSDIIVDTEEWIVEEDPNIVKVTVKKLNNNNTNENKLEFIQTNEEKDEKTNFETKDELTELKDGLILIQYPKGIKYFVYSASIGNVSFDGYVKTEEPLIDIIDNNLISDFIYNYVDVPDIDRILIILDKNSYNGTHLLNLVSYYTFNIGEMFCEIIQPLENPSNLLTFFRLLNLQDESLLIPFDNLQTIFYKKDNKLFVLDTKYISSSIDTEFLFSTGINPITDISEDFKEITIKDSYFEPDSLSPKVIFKAVASLKNYGIIDNNFQFKDRTELLDKIPIEILVKISKRDNETFFHIYRKKEISLSISNKQIEAIKELGDFIDALLKYCEKFIGKISNIIIYSFQDIEEAGTAFINLGLFPKKFSKKVSFFSGDPALLSIKFFSYKSVPAFINNHFKEVNNIELYKNENFNSLFKK